MTLEEVKQIPMREVVENYGLQPSRGGFIRCPFHQEKSGSMKIYARNAHCFGCGWSGDQIDFIRCMDNLSFKEAFLFLGGSYENAGSEEARRKIRLAEEERRKKAEERARLEAKKERNNRYITALRNGIGHFQPFSDEWCLCQNELPQQLYLHDILNGAGDGP